MTPPAPDFTLSATTARTRAAHMLSYVAITSVAGAIVPSHLPPGELLRLQSAPYHAGSILPSEASAQEIAAPRTVGEKLSLIRESLGVSTSTLARITAVSRPTIYQWAKEENKASPAAESRQRLDSLSKLALSWRAAFPGRSMDHWLTGNLPGQPSLLDLLSESSLNASSIEATLDSIIRQARNAETEIAQTRGAAGMDASQLPQGSPPENIRRWTQTRHSMIRTSRSGK